MTGKTVFFNDALTTVANLITGAGLPTDIAPLVIRDIRGRIRIALDGEKTKHQEVATRLATSMETLGAFAGNGGKGVMFPEDF